MNGFYPTGFTTADVLLMRKKNVFDSLLSFYLFISNYPFQVHLPGQAGWTVVPPSVRV